MHVPDYVEPIIGWRIWDVVQRRGVLFLESPLYRSTWPLRREHAAVCRPRPEGALALLHTGRFGHAPPDIHCGCGIYAGHVPAQAVAYMSRFFKARGDVVHRVLGTVSLWGTILACQLGWRASHAYPSRIFVPVPTRRLPLWPGTIRPPRRPVEDVAFGLAAYGVPVELVECASLGELDRILASSSDELAAA